MNRRGIALVLLWVLEARVFGAPVSLDPAPLAPDQPNLVQSLPGTPSPHWVWVNDIVFTHMASGQALLVDGDAGSSGCSAVPVLVSSASSWYEAAA